MNPTGHLHNAVYRHDLLRHDWHLHPVLNGHDVWLHLQDGHRDWRQAAVPRGSPAKRTSHLRPRTATWFTTKQLDIKFLAGHGKKKCIARKKRKEAALLRCKYLQKLPFSSTRQRDSTKKEKHQKGKFDLSEGFPGAPWGWPDPPLRRGGGGLFQNPPSGQRGGG